MAHNEIPQLPRCPNTPRRLLLAAAVTAAACVAGCSGSATDSPRNYVSRRPDATVDMHIVQAGLLATGASGSGTLFYQGRSYPFTVASGGIGGLGASTLDAEGNVYNLTNIAKFAGTYAQGRYGFAAGNTGAGELWLKNAAGVVMNLKGKRAGLMLTLGGDVVVITMGQK